MRILKSDEFSQILGGSEGAPSNSFIGVCEKIRDTAVENRDVIAGFLTSVSLLLAIRYVYHAVSARAVPFDHANGG